MSKARVAVLKVISKELSVTDAAAQYGYSRQHLHRLIARYRAGGLDAVEPQSRRPLSCPQATEDKVREFIVRTRLELTACRLGRRARHHRLAPGAGRAARPVHRDDPPDPARRRAGHPRSRYRRFEAAQPNECWQSDFTHWALDGGTDAEIINWLDDHSRYLLGCSAWAPVTGKVVVDTFLQASNTHGLPASTLTDNGRVYTARFGGGRNAFEYLLGALGITQKNGHPFHPRPRARSNGSTRPRNAGWPGSRPPPPWQTCRPSSTPSAATTTRTAPTGHCSAPPPARPTGPCPKPSPAAAPRTAITGCATTTSTPAAK
jgi:hypothetical protein